MPHFLSTGEPEPRNDRCQRCGGQIRLRFFVGEGDEAAKAVERIQDVLAEHNASIVEASFPINDNVFSHTVGDVQSYPSAGEKNSLLSQYDGLENGPISVGQGQGSDGLGIDVSTAISLGASLGVEYEESVEVTAGPAMAIQNSCIGVSGMRCSRATPPIG